MEIAVLMMEIKYETFKMLDSLINEYQVPL